MPVPKYSKGQKVFTSVYGEVEITRIYKELDREAYVYAITPDQDNEILLFEDQIGE